MIRVIILIVLVFSNSIEGCTEKKPDNPPNHLVEAYICPPCGCDSQGKIFREPGACPSCGMELIEVEASENMLGEVSELKPLKPIDKKMNVAIFLFDGNQVLDYAGPYDVFAASGNNFNTAIIPRRYNDDVRLRCICNVILRINT